MNTDELLKSDKNFHFQEINRLFAEASEIRSLAEKMGEKYVKWHTPYKIGQKVIVSKKYHPQFNGVIVGIRFNKNSTLKAMSILTVERRNKDFSIPTKRYNHQDIKDIEEIIIL